MNDDAPANLDDNRQDELWTAKEVAGYFRVSTPRAYALMASGQIPLVRIGRSVRVSRRELEKWIQEQSLRSIQAA
jgi:excisionase family DNA binding protein